MPRVVEDWPLLLNAEEQGVHKPVDFSKEQIEGLIGRVARFQGMIDEQAIYSDHAHDTRAVLSTVLALPDNVAVTTTLNNLSHDNKLELYDVNRLAELGKAMIEAGNEGCCGHWSF